MRLRYIAVPASRLRHTLAAERSARSCVALCMTLAAVTVSACGSSGGDKPASSDSTGKATTSTDASAPAAMPKRNGIVPFEHPAPGSGKGLRLGYISLGDSVPFVKNVSDSMRREAERAGATLLVCDAQLDPAKTLQCAQNFKVQQVQGYIVYQISAQAAAGICAAGPRVPVIGVQVVDKPCAVATMGDPDYRAGFLTGQAIGRYAQQHWNCAYDAYISVEALSAGKVNTDRMNGNRRGFQSVCPGPLKHERIIDSVYQQQARTKFTDTLTALPTAHRIVVNAVNDGAIEGAIAAARAAGRAKDIYVTGQGVDQTSTCGMFHNPNWIADTAYFPERWGEIGIPWLIKAVKGQRIPPLLYADVKLATQANYRNFGYSTANC